MMQYGQPPQQGQLPAPIDRVMTEQAVTQQLPPVPQSQVAGYMTQQELQGIHQELISQIQAEAHKTFLRTFLFNLYSQSFYQNQGYQGLFDSACKLYVALRATNQAHGFQHAVQQTVLSEMPLLVSQYPILQQYLNPQQQQDLQNQQQQRDSIGQFIQQVFQQGQQPQQGGFGGGGMNYGGFGSGGGAPAPANRMGGPVSAGTPPGFGGAPGGFPPGGGGAPGPAMGGGPMSGPMGGSPMGGMGSNRPVSAMGSGNQNANARSMLSNQSNAGSGMSMMGGGPPPTSASSGGDGGAAPMPSAPTGNNNPPVKTNIGTSDVDFSSTSKEDSVMPTPTDRGIAHEFAMEEEAATELETLPARPITAPGQVVIKQKDEHGRRIYVLKEVGNMEGYEAHEDRSVLLNQVSKKAPNTVRDGTSDDWKDLTATTPIEEIGEEGPKEAFEPISLFSETAENGGSHQHPEEAYLDVLDRLQALGYENPENQVFETFFLHTEPMELSNKDASAIAHLRGARSLSDFMTRFSECGVQDPESDTPTLSPRYWHQLLSRYTELFLDRIRGGLGDRVLEFDNLVDDYEDIMDYLRGKVSEVALDRFKEHTFDLLKSATMVRNLSSTTRTAKEKTERYMRVERHALVYLPWTTRSMRLNIEDDYRLLTQSANADVAAAFKRLMKRVQEYDAQDDTQSITAIHVTFADGEWLELTSTDLGSERAVMVKHKPHGPIC